MTLAADRRYDNANDAWKALSQAGQLMTPTADECRAAVKQLLREFDRTEDRAVTRTAIRTSVYHWLNRESPRRVWVGKPDPHAVQNKGWPRLIHDVSHAVFKRQQPRARPHDPGHDRLETRMVEFAITRNWHAGALRREEPVHDEVARLRERLLRWQAKERRSANAIKKLERKLRRLDKA